MKRHQEQLLPLHMVQLTDDQLLAILQGDNVLQMAVSPVLGEGERPDAEFAPQQLFLLAAKLLERHLVGIAHLTLVIEQQAALIHVGHQIEKHLVDPVRQAMGVEQLGHEDGGDVAHVVTHILQIVAEPLLLFGVEGHQADHPDAALLHHNGDAKESPLPATLLAVAAITHGVITSMGDDLFPLVLNHVAQQPGVALQLAAEELAIGAGSGYPHQIVVDNLDFQLQHARQHLGKAQDGRLDLHQQTLVAHGSHPSFLFVLVILPRKGVMLARY